MQIILASSSPRRKELLENAGFEFKIYSKDTDETFDDSLSIIRNVELVGLKKALEVQKEYPEDIIIGCDTIVVYNNEVFGKPKCTEDAFQILKTLSNSTHEVISGVGIIYKEEVYNFHVISKVTFKDLTDEEIYEYIETKESFGKAGAYAIQGAAGKFVVKYEGELENIVGLPIIEVAEVLNKILVK